MYKIKQQTILGDLKPNKELQQHKTNAQIMLSFDFYCYHAPQQTVELLVSQMVKSLKE